MTEPRFWVRLSIGFRTSFTTVGSITCSLGTISGMVDFETFEASILEVIAGSFSLLRLGFSWDKQLFKHFYGSDFSASAAFLVTEVLTGVFTKSFGWSLALNLLFYDFLALIGAARRFLPDILI